MFFIRIAPFLFLFLTSCAVKKTTTSFEKSPQTNSTELVKTVKADAFEELLTSSDVQLIDVRTPEEFESGHINNAINFDYNQESFHTQVNQLNKDEPVYLYCRSGKRSSGAAELLKAAGFTHIVNLDGGIIAWEEAKLPLKGKSIKE